MGGQTALFFSILFMEYQMNKLSLVEGFKITNKIELGL